MPDPIISRDVIKCQARAAVDSGRPITDCPYLQGTPYAKRWIAEYLMREIEVDDQKEVA